MTTTRKNSIKVLPHRSDERLAALIATEILPELSEINSILDIGCGDGIVGKLMPENCIYQGIDLSNAAIYEQNKEDVRITYSNPKNLDQSILNSNKADASLMLDVLEHTAKFTDLFEKALKRSKRYSIVSLPNELFFLDRLRLLMGKEHPAHSLDLIGQPEGFKHQYLINIAKAKILLSQTARKHNFTLKEEWLRPLVSKNRLIQPGLLVLKLLSTSQFWSMGSIFVFEKVN
ncbi:oxidoreductase [Synechococcus sp. MIT S9220]|uniref:class I SAM-dependent methyltransferase n=1 Tax=unclassified Synechococcus TaxID=2626047 RepID=UPI00164B4BAB|nr:methionine biosynthesis protein MetW [Synechococcus sp. MIT S9220]NOL48040.1 class I SAM-dependent methyltransferase [Synechococcus sp. MIT S9220]QNJ21522.1 oxidoreductase [Synechococcus sp. MIT S9220]